MIDLFHLLVLFLTGLFCFVRCFHDHEKLPCTAKAFRNDRMRDARVDIMALWVTTFVTIAGPLCLIFRAARLHEVGGDVAPPPFYWLDYRISGGSNLSLAALTTGNSCVGTCCLRSVPSSTNE